MTRARRFLGVALVLALGIGSGHHFVCPVFGQESNSARDPLVIACSTTQVADFTRQVVGDDCVVHCVLGAGVDPHSYQVKSRDADMVAAADLCLQNGWNLEGHQWMEKLATNANKPIVSCVDGIPPIELDESSGTTRDPHAWFSPRNAAIYVRNILNAVSKLDPENEPRFRARAEMYLNQLRVLDNWIKSQVVAIPANRRVLVTHHDAFGYFCRDFGFKAVSPAGWTTRELAGIDADKRQQVIKSIRELGVKSLFIETSVESRMLQEISKEAGVAIGGSLYSDAMGAPGSAGETYLGMMRENVLTIVAGLK